MIDALYYEECEEPSKLNGGSENELVLWISDLLSLLKSCQEKTRAHIQLLENLFPQPKEMRPNSTGKENVQPKKGDIK